MQAIQPIPKSNLREDILENLGTPHEIAFFYGNFGKILYSGTANQKMLFHSPMKIFGN